MSRNTTREQRETLQVYFKDLVSANGGTHRIEHHDITRVKKSNLSDYGNINRPDINAPNDVILDLELAAGDPIVTREIARMQGYALMQMRFNQDIDPAVAGHLAKVGKEVADVFAEVGHAMADNGQIDPDEAPRIGKELDEAIDVLVQLRGYVKQIETPIKKGRI